MLYDRIIQVVYETGGVGWYDIIMMLLTIIGICFAYKISREQMDLSNKLKEYQERQIQTDVLKFKIEGAKDDLGRSINQLSMLKSSIRYLEEDNLKDTDGYVKLKEHEAKLDLFIGDVRELIRPMILDYNNHLDLNPMGFKTKGDAKNLSSDDIIT